MAIHKTIQKMLSTIDVESIPVERKERLLPLITYIEKKISDNKPILLNFICTHNSRRSHLSQVWAQTMAYHFGLDNVFCYSGGTEATAVFPVIVDTLRKTGFQIQVIGEQANPIYSVKYAENAHPVIAFSKRFNDDFNPKSDFAAIMTCSHADENCPIVSGTDERIPITFEDPKAFDNMDLQIAKYAERSLQIATELYYVFSKIQ